MHYPDTCCHCGCELVQHATPQLCGHAAFSDFYCRRCNHGWRVWCDSLGLNIMSFPFTPEEVEDKFPI
jgi:hypothetical protein